MKRVSAADLEAALALHPGRPWRGGRDRIEAAVCVPVLDGGDGLAVWCIKRPDGLRHHSREIAFPGGKPEPGDAGLVGTALRETEEELGVNRSRLRVIGTLTPVPTATSRFTLNPVVVEV
ncbi:MAG: CoA pyrophosphatase, partial [Candidatus Dormibacteraeota bacterium]|nr:CoA pyrophosphatase [Candidatus Dormibacteraeota bacterium]